MRTLIRSASSPRAGGDALNIRFPELERLEVAIRTEEVSMIAGAPGAGKSTIAMAVAIRSQAPTLYVCADTSEHTMRVRAAAMHTGDLQSEVETRMEADPNYARQVQEPGSHIWWVFPESPSIESINEEIWAYEEVMGASPELIVVDNLMDVAAEGGLDEWAGLRKTMKALKHVAKSTGAALLVLHHTSESDSNDGAPSMRSVQGKVNQLPALILTVGKGEHELYVAAVKNRYGQADPFARRYTAVPFDGARMQLGSQA